jgi:two-component system chemotaxis response regulator CheB
LNDEKVRALVVDDTVLYRRVLTEALEATGEAEVVAAAPHGRLALSRLEQTAVDLVLLDVEMPELDGIATLAEIQKLPNPPVVVMISGQTTRSAQSTLHALENGAFDFIRKPDSGDPEVSRKELVDKLRPLIRHVRTRKNLRQVQKVETPAAPRPAPAPAPRRSGTTPQSGFAAVALGISTGGPNALGELIPHLPADLAVPVLLVQHMPPGFTASLAEHLARRSKIRVKEGEEGEPVLAGTVYIAPGGKHMVLRRLPEGGLIVGLNEQPPVNSCRPSVDVLFRSVAAQLNAPVLAVIMTGMGNDGCEGVRTLKRQSCYCLTQTESSCVVYGMPMAVDEAGLSDEQVPLELMASRVTQLVQKKVRHGD